MPSRFKQTSLYGHNSDMAPQIRSTSQRRIRLGLLATCQLPPDGGFQPGGHRASAMDACNEPADLWMLAITKVWRTDQTTFPDLPITTAWLRETTPSFRRISLT